MSWGLLALLTGVTDLDVLYGVPGMLYLVPSHGKNIRFQSTSVLNFAGRHQIHGLISKVHIFLLEPERLFQSKNSLYLKEKCHPQTLEFLT